MYCVDIQGNFGSKVFSYMYCVHSSKDLGSDHRTFKGSKVYHEVNHFYMPLLINVL